jgi:predicted Zn-ribbon and HTH transcriptional regulator
MADKEGIIAMKETDTPSNTSKISALKQKIHDKDYLLEAIQRIAYILSNEIAGMPGERRTVERKR